MTSREKEVTIVGVIFVLIAHLLFWAVCYQAGVITEQRQLIQKMYHDCPASPSNPKEIK